VEIRAKARYVNNGHGPCLEAGVFEVEARMTLVRLQEWQRVLRVLPGVVETRIVHNGRKGLRDQVQVTHLRDWTE
jgi:hypothetical protein